METLKIAYADFWPEWNDENFIEPILRKHYNVVIDQQNPDVLFHSIFGKTEAPKYKCKKVLFLGLILVLAGCSTHTTKDTRAMINQNSADIAELKARPVIEVVDELSCSDACSAEMDEKVDRAFMKSQYK